MGSFYSLSLPDDTPEMVRRKKIMITFSALGAIISCGMFGSDIGMLLTVYLAVCITINFGIVAWWLVRKKIPDGEASMFLLFVLCSVLMFDVTRWSEMRDPMWPAAVLVLDLMLVCKLPQRTSLIATAIVSWYLIANVAERVFRFGLYDVVAYKKMAEIRGCYSATPEEIEASPCKIEVAPAISAMSGQLVIFLLDYYFTRGFAVGMQREKEKLQQSVSLAESVVSSLVCFDLEAAASQIECEEATPLTDILNQLLQNLHQYRPYLPDSLFERMSEERCHQPNVVPPKDHAAIIFTDLKSSTAIWEACPDAMKRALKIHNNIIRNCLQEYEGYEVKTIGDSFMAAFEDLGSGCQFAITVQEKFSEAAWPTDLILPDEFVRNGWRGLMARIGLHYGEVSTEMNELSGRMDYFGRTVNRAARLEGVCIPGGVAIDSSMMGRVPVPEEWYQETVSEVLKGIEDSPIDVCILLSRKNAHIREAFSSIVSSDNQTITTMSSTISLLQIQSLSRMDKRLSATTCVVHLPLPSSSRLFQEDINVSFTKTISCLERTEGSIISVVSSYITIGWNTARVSATHRENGIRFISLMHSSFPSVDAVHHGIASSSVHCGTVGTRDQRFVTVFGDCIVTCGLLCQACCDLNTFALSNLVSGGIPARPVDRWLKNGSDQQDDTFMIYEIQVSRLRTWLSYSQDTEAVDKKATQEREWGDDYWSAFNRGDWKTMSSLSSSDRVLITVSEMLRTGKSLRYRPRH
eukprot:TRINITY_DN20277_c0_g2_i1.p1 TRINITY_DN20277_c0_g2~~TRINITY_DN20277_c0_g2_i1.p1  ORF type:complete len:748 (+),score=115.71 TRINITY_DN20277_c0_g2_i1:85-2328(+)